MAENSKIEWTDHTFNPWMGCSKVHTGCTNCYAETLMDSRWGKVQWGPNGTRVVAADASWRNPVKWNKAAMLSGVRARVFCASLADIFEDWHGQMLNAKGNQLFVDGDDWFTPGRDAFAMSAAVTMDDVRSRLFALIDATPCLDWLILTKRPENIRKMWPQNSPERTAELWGKPGRMNAGLGRHNVWLITSVSNQESADKQIPELLKCRDLVPVLGVSAEPLLDEIDFGYIAVPPPDEEMMRELLPMSGIDCVNGATFAKLGSGEVEYSAPQAKVDWIIVGGESGKKARPCGMNWIASIQKQCKAAGVAVFVKQLGSNPTFSDDCNMENCRSEFGRDRSKWYMTKDPKGGDWDEWPEEFRVREYPTPPGATP